MGHLAVISAVCDRSRYRVQFVCENAYVTPTTGPFVFENAQDPSAWVPKVVCLHVEMQMFLSVGRHLFVKIHSNLSLGRSLRWILYVFYIALKVFDGLTVQLVCENMGSLSVRCLKLAVCTWKDV